MRRLISRRADTVVLAVALLGLAAGAASALLGADDLAERIWTVTSVFGLVLSVWWVLDAARHRRLGVDVIALLARRSARSWWTSTSPAP